MRTYQPLASRAFVTIIGVLLFGVVAVSVLVVTYHGILPYIHRR